MRPEIYQRQYLCPICGSGDRTRAVVGLARDKNPGYLIALSRRMRVPIDEIVGPLEDWKCETCHCIYVDPSLSVEALNSLYQEAAPIHNAGWSAFTQKLLGEPAGEKYLGSIAEHIIEKGIHLDKYLEVGCPFTGLSVYLAETNRVRQGFRRSFADSDDYPVDSRRRIHRHATRIQRLSQLFMATYLRLWLSLHDSRKTSQNDIQPGMSLMELSFLSEFSGNRWSLGCNAFGSNCLKMAKSTLDARILSTGQIRNLPDGYFDLSGIFNTLDHSDSPLEILGLVARKSKHVLVTVHTLEHAYLQHRFAFAPTTIPQLCSQLGLTCQDLSNRLGKQSNAWMSYMIMTQV